MSADDRPNILVIMTDQHSKHVLGCYGEPRVRTPNLDRLAGQGMRFTGAYCPSPLCVPSRMSFMTGLHPHRNRVWCNRHILSSNTPTWAHVLGLAGYETTLIGRMHFEGPDQRHGFERRTITEFWAKHPGAPFKGGPAWQAFPWETADQQRISVETSGKGRTAYQWYDELVTESACRYLEEKAGDQDGGSGSGGRAGGSESRGRPFAAVVGYVLPHCPFIAPEDLFDYYYDLVDVPEVERDQPESILRYRRIRNIIDPYFDERRVRIARAAYFALCEYSDRLIGRVLDTLEQTGLSRNTVVVYCSDHGESAGEHGCWWKANYYESSVSIPLIVRHPDLTRRGGIQPAACSLVDLGPTFAEIAGAEPIPGADGRSILPLLRDEGAGDESAAGARAADWTNETFSELIDRRIDRLVESVNLPSRMIRSGRWKLWHFADSEGLPPSLFDLESDPGEMNDLGRSPDHEDTRQALLSRLLEGWDPEELGRQAAELTRGYELLCRWAAEIEPEIPGTLEFPPPSLERDVRIL